MRIFSRIFDDVDTIGQKGINIPGMSPNASLDKRVADDLPDGRV